MRGILDWLDNSGFYTKTVWDADTEKWVGAGKMRLLDFQRRILGHCFTPNADGELPYTTVVYAAPKKSGKTTILALIGAWAAECAPEGSEIYSVANDMEQAQARAFTDIKYHIQRKHDISGTAYRIEMDNGTFVQAIAQHYASAAGARQFLTMFDELWAYMSERSRRMWAEMTPPPSVPNAMRVVVTYAGFENESDQLLDLYNMCFKRENGEYIHGEIVPELADIVNARNEPVCRRNGRTFVYWETEPRMPWQTPEYYCLPLPKHKQDLLVLTDCGWKAAEDVTVEDHICTRNNETSLVEYQNPSSIFRAPYTGDLLRLKNTKANLVMTPNHRVLAAYASHTRKVKDILSRPFQYEYRQAQEAVRAQVGWIPGHGEWDHAGIQEVTVSETKRYNGCLFIQLLAWFLSEGHVVHRTYVSGERYAASVFLAQDKKVNPEKYEQIRELCDRMGLCHATYPNGVQIFDQELARWFDPFGHSQDKFIPRWLLDGASKNQMRLFLETYMLGDGSKRPNSILLYTNSDQMKLDLMELVFKAGYRPRYLGAWSSAPEKGRKAIHHISVLTSHIGWSTGNGRQHWTEEDAPAGTEVWCPTLPNGNFYVMQNGVCWWSGNSEQMTTLRPADFLRMHRNTWVSSTESFIPTELWDRAAKKLQGPLTLFKDSPLRAYPISVGIDIGMKHDCSALVGVYYDSGRRKAGIAFHHIWTPPKDGTVLDLEYTVEMELEKLWKEYQIVSVCYDPTQFQRSAVTLQRKGLPLVEFPQTAGNMIQATQALYDLLKTDNLEAYPDNELRDHIRYASAETTARGFRLVKGKNAKYAIDAAIALAMACFDAVNRGGVNTTDPVKIISPFSDATTVYIPTIGDIHNMKLPAALRD